MTKVAPITKGLSVLLLVKIESDAEIGMTRVCKRASLLITPTVLNERIFANSKGKYAVK